jgi:hypothetical protein
MSAFDIINLNAIMIAGERFSNAQVPIELASLGPMQDGDFKARLASIFTCYHELRSLLASRGHCEYVAVSAETLGEAIRAVPWTADSFEHLLGLRTKDIQDILEAIQMVRLASPVVLIL